jgi:hypothetical protein
LFYWFHQLIFHSLSYGYKVVGLAGPLSLHELITLLILQVFQVSPVFLHIEVTAGMPVYALGCA